MAEASNNDSDVSSLADDTIGNMFSDEFPSDLKEIVSIKTEDSILQEISEHIKRTTKSNNQHRIQDDDETNAEGNIEVNSKENYKAELQKQVEIEEITPFEAVFEQSALEHKEGLYLRTPDKDTIPIKKTKLLDTDTRTNKKCQKSKHENGKDNTVQSIDKTDSNEANKIVDNSSGSEYISSDNEVDFARDNGDNQLFKQRIETNTYPKDEAMHKIDTLFKMPQYI
ncbi:hypothetical protein ALC57_17045 [Trachymyrmex cornetzi]|uniref:Uncharacterized protein n=1 Tax=Trachymyrmex cornetzi TaxID=471704 RepID=A0A195DD63_9HYME|nr:hypothetical protein ALC57_17045 [Trachymyrmex cornetzi]